MPASGTVINDTKVKWQVPRGHTAGSLTQPWELASLRMRRSGPGGCFCAQGHTQGQVPTQEEIRSLEKLEEEKVSGERVAGELGWTFWVSKSSEERCNAGDLTRSPWLQCG